MQYVCSAIENNQCVQWVQYVEQSNFITELSSLTYADANELLTKTVALFALAWVSRLLSKQAYQPN